MMDGDRRKQMGEALGRLHVLDPAIRQLRKTTQGVTLNMRAHWGLADQRAALNSKGASSVLKSRQGGDVPGTLAFTCNICGRSNKRPMASIQREEPSCDGCALHRKVPRRSPRTFDRFVRTVPHHTRIPRSPRHRSLGALRLGWVCVPPA